MTADADDYQPDRRPITSRDRAISKRASTWMVRRGFTPNGISVAGMIAGIAVGVVLPFTLVSETPAIWFIAAAVLMQLRLLANMLDGMVAVESGTASPVGELYNEIPDRVSDTAMFVGAGYAVGSHPTLGFVAACLALFVAYLRAEGKVAGAQQEYCGPMAKPQRVFVMTLTALLCALLPTSLQQRVWIDFGENATVGLMGWSLLLISLGTVWTALRRLMRIAHTLRTQAP